MPSWPTGKAPRRRQILIFEPDAEGHSQEWLQHLVDYVAADETAPAIAVLAPPALCAALAAPAAADGRIRFIALQPREAQLCSHRLLSLAAFARWWIMRRHLRLSDADVGFFLSLDLLCLPLAFGLRAHGKPLAGILFRPSVHYGELGGYRPRFGERLRDLRKDLLYRLTLRNPAVGAMLSLDPFFPAHATSHYSHGRKVQAVPDPAHPPLGARCPARVDDFARAGRTSFLLFGYLTERKGPLMVLDALRLLPDRIAARVTILFAGRVDPAIRDAIEARRGALAREQPLLQLRIDDRRLDRVELEALVTKSDIVLAPYQRFVGSSGVLLWAARAGRPVLAQEFGLVGRLTRDHRLGAVADSSDPAKLAAQIERMVAGGPQSFIDLSSATRFASSRTPHRFASIVLACVGGNGIATAST
jgi:glycosyltransferase involved in cell wall biosynthesis